MTERTELTDREELILHAIVHTYITTAEAVGSRAIVRRFSLNLSPATVRNVMADLEEGGFLAHLHTSSGRVPADRGYRYYVDYLMHVHDLSPEEQARIDEDLSHGAQDAEAVMRQASHLLASLSRQTGMVEAPGEQEAELRRIEVVPLTANRVAVMLADSYGRVRTTPVTIEEGFPMVELPRVNRLNDHLTGVAVDKLKTVVQGKLQNLLDEQRQLANQAIRLLERLPKREPGEVFLDGTTQLFEQPEFRDIAKAREVFGLFEERHRLAQLLHALMTQGESPQTTVVIGSETREQGLEEISLVASPYRVGGKLVGMVGVLGTPPHALFAVDLYRLIHGRLSQPIADTARRLGYTRSGMKKGHIDKTELEKRLEAELDKQAQADLEESRATAGSDDESGLPDAMLSLLPSAEELEALTAERDDLKDQLLRSRADFDNYRKRLAREAERVRKTAAEGILRDLLPVADHLELALRHGEGQSGALAEGVNMVLKQLREVLGRHGLQLIAALGERFDPTVHEAISKRVVPDKEEHTVVEEVQTGYRLGDFVLRPAKVIVSIPSPEAGRCAEEPGVAESPER